MKRELDANAYTPPMIAPDERSSGLIGFLRAMITNPVGAIPASAYEDELAVLSFLGTQVTFVCAPALIEDILIKRVQEFRKAEVDDLIFKPVFGNSLLIAQGEDWRWKRRLAAPYFSPIALAKSVQRMIAPFDALSREWRDNAPGTTVNVSTSMTNVTAEVISATLFTNHDELDMGALSAAISESLMPVSWTIGLASLKVPAWVPHPGKVKIQRGQRAMRRIVGEAIAARRVSTAVYRDICAELMSAKDPESGKPLADTDLVDMVLTLVAAGHETTANALTWALFCLAEQPALQDELRSEIASVCGGGAIEADDIPAFVKVEAFIKETMRLFPPVPLLARRTLMMKSFGSQEFSPGTTLFIPIYAIHRHKRLWSSPDQFDMRRFLGEDASKIQRSAYLPFGAGPRVCIGGTFAMTEMILAIAILVRSLHFSTSGTTRCEPIHRITLRPRDGLQLAIQAVG